MGKLLAVGLGQKWRSSFSRTCLCNVCECGGRSKITISVRTSYGEVVGSRVKAKMAGEFFPVHAYTAYVSVEDGLKSLFLYTLIPTNVRDFQ